VHEEPSAPSIPPIPAQSMAVGTCVSMECESRTPATRFCRGPSTLVYFPPGAAATSGEVMSSTTTHSAHSEHRQMLPAQSIGYLLTAGFSVYPLVLIPEQKLFVLCLHLTFESTTPAAETVRATHHQKSKGDLRRTSSCVANCCPELRQPGILRTPKLVFKVESELLRTTQNTQVLAHEL